jgi:hypothetical protein
MMEHKDNNYVVLKQTLKLLRYLQKSMERIDIINYFSFKKNVIVNLFISAKDSIFTI